MSMINKTTDFYNTIYTLKKIECMFLNVPIAVNCNCSTVVFLKVSRSEPISLTCLQVSNLNSL